MAYYPSIFAIEQHRSAVLLRIVERYTLDEMGVRIGYGSRVEQRCPQSTVRRHEHGRVLGLLCESQELFTQGRCRLQCRECDIINPQPTQHWETLLRIFQVFIEMLCAAVGLFHLRSRV